MKIKTAVIPVAGLGTRFLPWTKSSPKELLPILNKPVIQYIVEEVVGAGIKRIVLVTGAHKRAIEDYFDTNFELEYKLKKAGKTKRLEEVRRLNQMAEFIFIRQKGDYGNGTPVLEAESVVGDEPFVVLWGDQFIAAKPSRLQQCLKVFEKHQTSVISGISIEPWRRQFCGMGKLKSVKDNVSEVLEIVEKPKPGKEPSEVMLSGVYILRPEIFKILSELKPGKDNEIWLVDAINKLMKTQKVMACEIKGGEFYDTGNKLAYSKTVVDHILKDKEVGKEMREYMEKKLEKRVKEKDNYPGLEMLLGGRKLMN